MIRRADGKERVSPFIQVAGVWFLVTNWTPAYENMLPGGPDALVLRPLGRGEEQLLRERLHHALVEAHAMITREDYEVEE